MKYSKTKIKKVLKHNCFKEAGINPGTLEHTLREFLKALFKEGEGFSGKRPLGNSGWNDIAAEALAILEPGIGRYEVEKFDNYPDERYFEVKNHKLYLKTFNWLVDYIFKAALDEISRNL